jgi:hypothetical protein
MAARQELKDLAKAIDVITRLRESAVTKESELVVEVLDEAELEWRRRYMEIQKSTARKPARKKPGGAP